MQFEKYFLLEIHYEFTEAKAIAQIGIFDSKIVDDLTCNPRKKKSSAAIYSVRGIFYKKLKKFLAQLFAAPPGLARLNFSKILS